MRQSIADAIREREAQEEKENAAMAKNGHPLNKGGLNRKEPKTQQVLYLDKWCDRKSFRAFVYDVNLNQKLAESYDEYEDLVASGIWFSTKELAKNVVVLEHEPQNSENIDAPVSVFSEKTIARVQSKNKLASNKTTGV